MAAIITKDLKRLMLERIYNETKYGPSKYYVAVGRSESWDSVETVPNPIDSERLNRYTRTALQAAKQTTDVTYVITRYNWTSGTTYDAIDDNYSGISSNSYYVLTEDNNVYLCLEQSKQADGTPNGSTIKPTGESTIPFMTSDGYVWKYMYSVSGTAAATFLSSSYMPVEYLDSATIPGLTATQLTQVGVRTAARKGQILGIAVDNGGTGYSSAPTVTILGNGTGATATATVSSGAIVNISLDSAADSCRAWGKNYDYASISLNGGGGSGAVVRAIVAQDSGLGSDPVRDLRSTALMFNAKPAGAEGFSVASGSGGFIVGQDFRQIALIRNPQDSAGSFEKSVGTTLRQLTLVGVASYAADTIITGAGSGAKAIVDAIGTGTFNKKVYYHQNDETGFKSFTEGETINGGGIAGVIAKSGSKDSVDGLDSGYDGIDWKSGELLYIENRSPVARSGTQTEDIKIVMQL